jgi:hypothetical protein
MCIAWTVYVTMYNSVYSKLPTGTIVTQQKQAILFLPEDMQMWSKSIKNQYMCNDICL